MKSCALLTIFLLPVAGCGLRPPSDACASSVVTQDIAEKTLQMSKDFKLPQEIPGGFLDVSVRTSWQSNSIERRRCSAMLTFEHGRPDLIRVWTAQHCTRYGLMEDMTLYLDSGEGYIAIPLSTADLETAQNIRPLITSIDRNFLESVEEVLDGGNDFRIKNKSTGLERCMEREPATRTLCFTVFDLTTFDASLLGAVSPQQKEALARARSVSDLILARFENKEFLRDYHSGVSALLNSRKISAIEAFVRKTDRCQSGELDASRCGHSFAQEGEMFRRRFLNVEDFKRNNFQIRPQVVANTPSLSAARELWMDALKESIPLYTQKLQTAWATFDSPAFMQRHPFVISTNMVVEQNEPYYGWLPSLATKVPEGTKVFEQGETYEALGTNGVSSRTFLFKNRGPEDVRFSFGDSGSLLTFAGLPVAALSMKDSEETSSSAVVPLPAKRKPPTQGTKPASNSSLQQHSENVNTGNCRT